MVNQLGDLPYNLYPEKIANSGQIENQSALISQPVKSAIIKPPAPGLAPVIDTRRAVKNAQYVSQIQNVTDTSKNVLNHNPQRTYLIIQNNGVSDVFINFSNRADSTNMRIASGGYYEPLVAPTNSIFLTSSTGNSNLCVVTEGT